ncbi:NADAR family protein [bacterium]|nr:NADAR family protein [bacterium]
MSFQLASAIAKRRLFYSGKKGGVGYKVKNNPLLTKEEVDEAEWLSNYYPAPFELDGTKYATSEHRFQSQRFKRGPRLESNEMKEKRMQFAAEIAAAKTANTAFMMARYVSFRKKDNRPYVKTPFPSQNWIRDVIMGYYNKGLMKFEDNHASDFSIMVEANRAKFSQNPVLRAKLIATRSDELIEHTKRDSLWGDGGDGTGANALGRALMQVRSELM